MNILIFSHYTALYGANRSLLNLLKGLKTYDVKAMVVVPENGDLCRVLSELDIPFIVQKFDKWCGDKNLPFFKRKYSLIGIFKNYQENRFRKIQNLNNIEELNQKIKDFKPDVIYSNSSVFNFGFLFSRKKNLPHIWHLRESQDQYFLNWFDNIKKVNKTFNQSEIILAVSKFLKNYYEEKNNVQDIAVIYNGVLSGKELENIDRRRQEKEVIGDVVVFGIVGLIHPQKGQEEAIKAFAMVNKQYPNTKLLVVGLGDTNSLEKLSTSLSLDHCIEFWGHISDPFDAYLEMDIALMCSRMEGMGRVTVEAMAAGLPIIGYNEGGTTELIEDNITGLLYEKGSLDLAEKMIILVKDKKRRLAMGEKGRIEFAKKYTSEVYTANFIEILNKYNFKVGPKQNPDFII